MTTEHVHAEELDLAIPDMDSETAELAVKASLRNLPGIIRVLLVGRGAFASYDPNAINKDQICAAVRQAGYRASVFQDSKTEQTGRSSQ
jgi:copper chaperone CopZ